MKKTFPLFALFTASIFNACSGDSSTNAGSHQSANDEWRNYCLEVVNKYRATEDLEPLVLAGDEKQKCTDNQSAADLKDGKAHGHFGDCGEFAQNSAPNISLSWLGTEKEIVDYYLESMWNEKKLVESGERDPNNSADFSAIGHYLNMSRKNADTISCGFAKSSDGKTGWMNINFY